MPFHGNLEASNEAPDEETAVLLTAISLTHKYLSSSDSKFTSRLCNRPVHWNTVNMPWEISGGNLTNLFCG